MEAFELFDANRNQKIKPSDLKRVFAEYLEHPVTDSDIADIMAACDQNNLGEI